MEYVSLSNGIKLPLVGFGTWDLRGKQCFDCVKTALSCGYRLIDTAKMYGNEKEVGQAIKASGIDRQEIIVTTKLDRNYNSYQSAKAGIQESLATMELDYIDIVLIHEPYANALAMYQVLQEAYQAGLVKAIGVSNFHARFYQNFIKDCKVMPMINQVEAHVFFNQRKLQPILKQTGTIMEAWSPLAVGKQNLFNHPLLIEIGAMYQKTPAQIALKYLIQQGIVVIPKSSNYKRMLLNIDLFDFCLTESQMNQIASLDQNRSLFNWYNYD